MWKKLGSILTVTILFNAFSCANLTQLLNTMQVKKPGAKVTGARITDATFRDLDMVFDLEIDNPNNISVALAGFDYKLDVNDNAFVQGDQQSSLEIEKYGKSTLPIPVTVVFADLYNLFTGMKSRDSTTYKLSCGLTFDVPVLGNVRVPVSYTGSLPLLKIPSISLKNIQIDRIGLGGADLSLNIGIKNPNPILLKLQQLDYSLDINGFNWVSGTSNSLNEVSPKGESVLKLPLSLNFLEMGRNIFALLNGSSKLDYRFTGNLAMGTSWNLLNNINLSLDDTGKVPVLK
jgi:LEA14-like dessication related protein